MKKHSQKMTLLLLLLMAVGASAQQNTLDKLGLPLSTHLAVAYSLRQLSSKATKAIEVRRGSDSKVQDIGFDENGNLDIAALETFVGAGAGFVSKWYDQSGNKIDAVQTDNSQQPKIAEAGKVLMEGGRPILYTAENAYLKYSGLTQFKGLSTVSRFSVCNIRKGDGSGIIDGLGTYQLDFAMSTSSPTAGLQTENHSIGIYDAPLASTANLMVVAAIRESKESSLYVNKNLVAISYAELGNFDASIEGYIGRRNDNGSPGEYSEMILYNSVLDETTSKKIADNQYAYYKIVETAVVKQNTLDKLGLPLSTHLAVAYSLRQLSSKATKAIEVRRGSDNKLQDIGFDENGNLNIAALETFLGASDGFVSKWYDQSGNNIDAVQTDNSQQPTIADAGNVLMEGGRPILYTSQNAYLKYSGLTQFKGLSTASRFSVCNIRKGNGGGIIDGFGTHQLDFTMSPSPPTVVLQTQNPGSGIYNAPLLSMANLMVVAAIRESKKSALYVNKKLAGKSDVELGNFDASIGGYIGRRDDKGNPGEYAEMILYNSALDEMTSKKVADNQYAYYKIVEATETQKNTLDKLDLPPSTHLAVAYSLRQLSSSATKAIEVRRGSKFQDIGFDENGNLDIAALERFVGAGDGYVSKWYDQSGNDIDAVQADNSRQPKIVESGKVLMEGGRPILYTAENAYLQYNGLTQFYGLSTASRFSVCNIRNGNGSGIIDGFGSRQLDFTIISSSLRVFLQTQNSESGIYNAPLASKTNLLVVAAIRESKKSALYVNKNLMGKSDVELGNFDWSIGGYIGRRDNTGNPGKYAEMILYNSALDETTSKKVADNQYAYYKITELGYLLSKYGTLGVAPRAAYSLRKISDSYKGSAIQVRRSSDKTTTDIGFDDKGDLNTQQLKDFVGGGDGYVSIWYDQCGMGNHKTQSDGPSQPQIASKGAVIVKNGKPAIFFPAQSKVGLVGPSKDYLSEGDITIFFTAWSNSNSAAPRRAIQGTGQHNWFVGPSQNSNAYWAGDWNLLDASNPWSETGESFTISQPAIGPNTVYRNGIEIMKYRTIAKDFPGSISISAAGFADEPFDGYMSELLEFDRALSREDIVKVQDGISSYPAIPCTHNNNNISALAPIDKPLAAVFSLRLINSEYEGPLVRVAAGASFYDIYPDAKFGISPDSPSSKAMSDYNAVIAEESANQLASILTNSTNVGVAIWYDQSGQGKHLKQPEDAYRPLLVKQGALIIQAENGKVALGFPDQAKAHLTGSDDFLTGYDDWYVNIVYTGNAEAASETSNGQCLLSQPQRWHWLTNSSAYNKGGYFTIYPEGTSNEKQQITPFFNPITQKSGANILSGAFTKESFVIYGNQVAAGKSSVGLPSSSDAGNSFQVGGIGVAADNKSSFTGLIQEIVITRGLSQKEQRMLETMQGVYYEISRCNQWIGTDENWLEDCNWSFGGAPSSADKVLIPSGSYVWPRVTGLVPAPMQIVVEPAAKVYLEGSFSGEQPKVDLLADEERTGMVVNRAGMPLGEVGIQKWFAAQKGFRVVANPFKNTQSLVDNSMTSGFAMAVNETEESTEKAAAPAAPSILISDAQYFTNNYWKNLISGTTQESIPYAIHYEGLSPVVLSDKANGPTPFPYYSKGEMYGGTSVAIKTANSTSQFTLAGNPFTAPVITTALTQGLPYYIFETPIGAKGEARRTESGMWIPYMPSRNAVTPILGVVAFKQVEASPTVAVPTSAIEDADLIPRGETSDYLQLELEKDNEYKDRLFVKLAYAYRSASSDKMDLEKMMNGEVNAYTMTPQKMKLAIDCRQKPAKAPIPVYVSFTKEGAYNFRVKHNGLADASELYLRDRLLSQSTKLEEGASYAFSVSDKENQSENRFEIATMGIPIIPIVPIVPIVPAVPPAPVAPVAPIAPVVPPAPVVPTGIEESSKKDSGVSVYPIPTKEELVIYSDKNMEMITIYDLNGRVILTKEVSGKNSKIALNDLRQGMYVISIQNEEGVQRLKFVKE